MKLVVTGRHMTVSPAAHEQIKRQLRRLQRLLGDSVVSAQCIISREGKDYSAELTLHARGDNMLHATARHARLETAVSGAAKKVGQQAQKVKDRWKSRRKGSRGRPAAPAATAGEPAQAPASAGPRVVRARISAKPLTIDDAILALEGSRDGVVVFRQTDSGSVAIVFRRPDGKVGLVDTGA